MTVLIGNAHDGSPALGKHLVKVENEVVIGQSSGVPFDTDLHPKVIPLAIEYLAQMGRYAHKKPLLHASINPHSDHVWSDQEWQQAIEAYLAEYNLAEQPHVVVFHEKSDGRRHCHVVALRIGSDGKLVDHLQKDYLRNEKLARVFDHDFCGGDFVIGRHNRAVITALEKTRPDIVAALKTAGLDAAPRPNAGMTPAERRQFERTGIDPRRIQRLAAQAWTQSDSGAAFAAALTERGLVLAQGTKVPVLVDRSGNSHPLLRTINKGLKSSDSKTLKKVDLDAKLPADLAPVSIVVEQVKNPPVVAAPAPAEQIIIPKTGNPFFNPGMPIADDLRFELNMRQAAPTQIPSQLANLLEEYRHAKTPDTSRADAVDTVDRASVPQSDRGDRPQNRVLDEPPRHPGDQLGRVDPGSVVGDQRADQNAGRSTDRAQSTAGSDPVEPRSDERVETKLTPKSPSPTTSTGRKSKAGPAMSGGSAPVADDKRQVKSLLDSGSVDNGDWSKLTAAQRGQKKADLAERAEQKWLAYLKQRISADAEEMEKILQRIRQSHTEYQTWLSGQTLPANRSHLKRAVGEVSQNRPDSSENLLDRVQKFSFERDARHAFLKGVEPLFAPSASGRYIQKYTEIAMELSRMTHSDLNDLRMVTAANFKDLGAVKSKNRDNVRFERELSRCGLTVIEDVMVKRGLISADDRMTTTQLRTELLIYPDGKIEGDVFEVSRAAIEKSILDQIDGNQVNQRQLDHLIKTDPAAFRRAMDFVSKKLDELGEHEWAERTRQRLQKHGADSKNPDANPDGQYKPGM